MAEKKCLCNAGVPKSEKKWAWVPLIFDLFNSKKNETNKNKKIYFNTVNNNKLSQDSGLFEISWNLDKVDANKVKCGVSFSEAEAEGVAMTESHLVLFIPARVNF